MKGFFVAILSILLLLCSLVSCEHKATTVDSVSFDTLSIDTICPLFHSYEKPACHLAISMAKPVAQTPVETLHAIERFISTLPKEGSFETDANGSVESMVHAYAKSYIIQYLNEGHDAIGQNESDADELKAGSTWMNYDENVVGNVVFNADGFLSYQVITDSYTGGAHGNKTIDNGVFDLTRLDQITLIDLFNEATIDGLNEKVRNKLMIQNQCSSLEELAEKGHFISPNEIEATENFYINEEGITWTFDPYEIAPFSVGEVYISLSWDEVTPFLAPESPFIEFAKKYSAQS